MRPDLAPLTPAFPATVTALHRVAELIVAPARKPDNEIALIATPGGFGTPEFEHDGARHQVRIDGAELVHAIDGAQRRAPLTTLAAAQQLVDDLVPPGDALDGAALDVDRASAGTLAGWYAFGDAILGDLGGAPTLWPEHFDIAIELGEEPARATYGFSPGDEHHAEPYAYVGPWSEVDGELWQATGFSGAEIGYAELLAAPDPRAAVLDFFETRRAAL
jgi:hypothetical protein